MPYHIATLHNGTILELTVPKYYTFLYILAMHIGKHTYSICQTPKLTPFWWESSIWNTSHKYHSWHSRVKLITSDTCASSQSGRLICIEEHSAEVIDAHTKYGHPMTPAPSQNLLPIPKALTANAGSESKSDCNKTQKHEWEALQWRAGGRTMGPALNKTANPRMGCWSTIQITGT